MRIESKKAAGTVPLCELKQGDPFEFPPGEDSAYMPGVFIRTNDQPFPPAASIIRATRLDDGYHNGFGGTTPVVPRPDLYVASDGGDA